MRRPRSATGVTTTAECVFDGCTSVRVRHGYCSKHGYRFVKYGDPNVTAPPGRPVGWGKQRYERDGYVSVLVNGQPKGEHRIVMEEMIGRALLPGETVHHKNGMRGDNRPENLELWSSSQPAGQRVTDKVAWAKEILALYGDLAVKET